MPTVFECVVDTGGTPGVGGCDFTSLASWWAAMRNTSGTLFVASKDPIAVPCTVTGSVPAGSTLTQQNTGKQAVLVYRNQAGYALLKSTGNGGSVGDLLSTTNLTSDWQIDANNYLRPTGARDSVTLKASCRGATPDITSVGWTAGGVMPVWSQSLSNAVVIEGNSDPSNLVWDTLRYRLEIDTLGAVLATALTSGSLRSVLLFRNLQARNTSTNTASWTAGTCVCEAVYNQGWLEGCILRGGKNGVHVTSGQGKAVLHNCVVYGASDAAVLDDSTAMPVVARNCTLVGGTYGFRANGGANCLAENTYAHGSTAGFAASGGGTITLNRCGSSDATANGGAVTLTVAAAGLSSVPKDTAAFRAVAAGSEDFRLAAGSPLALAGSDLSAGRSRVFADVSSASEAGNSFAAAHPFGSLPVGSASGAPLGVIAFEVGSKVAIFRMFNTVARRWYDGVDLPYDLSMKIDLPYTSTTGDWVVLISDTHFGRELKNIVGPAIDALSAGTTGAWNRQTDGAWVSGQNPCAGRLKHLVNLGDLGPTDYNLYGTGAASASDQTATGFAFAGYTDNLWNTSGLSSPPGAGCQSIPPYSTWHYTGNHDTTKAMAPTCNVLNNSQSRCHTELPGFETFRLNQHGRTASAYTGLAYADADELCAHVDVGNNRFVLLNYYGSGASGQWTSADTAWARWALTTSLPASSNLFVLVHAPMYHSTRFSRSEQPHDTQLEVALSLAPWAFSACGHCHNYAPAGSGPDPGCVLARKDYPTRESWDVGAGRGFAATRHTLRGVRDRALRSVRA